MADTSEEKSQPASDRKLREGRRKGQTARSQDMVSAVVLLSASLALLVLVPRFVGRLRAFFEQVADLYVQPFAEVAPRLMGDAQSLILQGCLPLFALVVVTVILTNWLITRGPVFSLEPLKPQFSRINPVEGLKRLFALRNFVEFLKGLVKVGVLSLAFYVLGRLGLQALLESSRCGLGCVDATFIAVLKPLAITLIVVYLALGLADILLQRWLFRRDQRMTRSEQKRERKDLEGDPAIRQERQRLRRETQTLTSRRTGLAAATLVLEGASGEVVGLRYRRGETPVPVVVCSAQGDGAQALRQQARAAALPIAAVGDLAARITRRSVPGEPIPEATFQEVADLLVQAGLI